MRRAAAILMVVAGDVLAHPGHGGLEGHLHGWGPEHGVLLAVILLAVLIAVRK